MPDLSDLFDAVDLAVDTNPLKLRNAIFAAMSLREATLPPNDRGKPREYAEGWTDGYNNALADVHKYIATALGVSREAPHVQ